MDLFPDAGPPIESASTIAVTHSIHQIEGTVTITTIEPPAPGFTGPLYLIGAFGAGADLNSGSGNIGGDSVVNQEHLTVLVFDGTTWWPTAV